MEKWLEIDQVSTPGQLNGFRTHIHRWCVSWRSLEKSVALHFAHHEPLITFYGRVVSDLEGMYYHLRTTIDLYYWLLPPGPLRYSSFTIYSIIPPVFTHYWPQFTHHWLTTTYSSLPHQNILISLTTNDSFLTHHNGLCDDVVPPVEGNVCVSQDVTSKWPIFFNHDVSEVTHVSAKITTRSY